MITVCRPTGDNNTSALYDLTTGKAPTRVLYGAYMTAIYVSDGWKTRCRLRMSIVCDLTGVGSVDIEDESISFQPVHWDNNFARCDDWRIHQLVRG